MSKDTPESVYWRIRSDQNYCAICGIDIHEKFGDPRSQRQFLFDKLDNARTETCLLIERYLDMKLDLRTDSRVICLNCRRRVKNATEKQDKTKKQLMSSRKAYSERRVNQAMSEKRVPTGTVLLQHVPISKLKSLNMLTSVFVENQSNEMEKGRTIAKRPDDEQESPNKLNKACESSMDPCKGSLDPAAGDVITEMNMPAIIATTAHHTQHIISTRRTSSMRTYFQCTRCGMAFSQKRALRQHKFTHVDVKKFDCTVCGKRFGDRSGLTRHTRIHSNEKRFECQVCHQAFRHSNGLTVHMRTHTGERSYSCSHCSLKFTQPGHRNAHVKSKHPGSEDLSSQQSLEVLRLVRTESTSSRQNSSETVNTLETEQSNIDSSDFNSENVTYAFDFKQKEITDI